MKLGRRQTIRITRLLFLLIAVTALAFTVLGGEPNTTIAGKVISTVMVNGICFEDGGAYEHWEVWRAEVQLQAPEPTHADQVTNLADKVIIYYDVDCSTSSVSAFSMQPIPPPQYLKTNQVYEFVCHRIGAGNQNFAVSINEWKTKPE